MAVLMDPDPVVVALHGEFDASTVDEMIDATGAASRAVASSITFDFSDVTFMDCRGVSALVRAHRALGSRPGTVVVRRPCDEVRFLLDTTGVATLVHVEP